jgi:molybdenum cofactor cytidylyltransferase
VSPGQGHDFTGILLAAGAGSRFGGGKLLHSLADGTPIGVAALRNLAQVLPRIIAVVRPGDDELAARLGQEGAQVIECVHAVDGMGHSLAAAVEADPQARGWVVALGDMPQVDLHSIEAVAAALAAGARIAVPVYRGKRGHPVGFAASCRRELEALRGDAGARSVLRRYAAEVVSVEVEDPGILQDVDTVEDLANLGTRREVRGTRKI